MRARIAAIAAEIAALRAAVDARGWGAIADIEDLLYEAGLSLLN